MNMMMMMMRCNPFTASQWQELEHQALVFKYMVSGIPVPPDLLRRTTATSSTSSSSPLIGWRFEMGSMDKKKIEAEPGRCRRTDGKKWRCSKDIAFPHSPKYCQRHMHRGTSATSTTTTARQRTTKDIINVRTGMRSVVVGNNESSSTSSSSVVSSSSLSSKLTMTSLMSQTKHDDNNDINNIQQQQQQQQKKSVMMMHDFFQMNKT